MIGNLFSAVSIALMSSVLALGQVKANNDAVIGSSWVNGAECEVLSHQTLSIRALPSLYWLTPLYNYVDNFDAAELPIEVVNIYDADFGYKYINANRSWDDYAGWDANCFAIVIERFNGAITFNGVDYYFGMRFGCSPLSNVNGFEWRCNANCTVYKYGTDFDGISYPYSYFAGGNSTRNAIGIYDISSSDARTDGTVVSGTHTDTAPFKFLDFLIMFELPFSTDGVNRYLDIDFQLINGTTDANFITGYNQGYTQGSSEGYAKGYAEGLNVSHNSSFMGLFSSIADTPLRFIYGLFNFDLFGTSVLVIVLTLLTGIIVFGIVKKFWK